MAELVKYIARQKFKYGGKWHFPGDEWTPAGSRYDASIIRNRLVSTVRIEAELKQPAAATSSPDAENPAPVRRKAKG